MLHLEEWGKKCTYQVQHAANAFQGAELLYQWVLYVHFCYCLVVR